LPGGERANAVSQGSVTEHEVWKADAQMPVLSGSVTEHEVWKADA
jgi:hypothetical protein